jgi:hypothetical protein
MPGDPALPARDWDFPPWQAARLLSGAAQDAARAWTQPVPAADILDVTWDLQQTFRDLGIALRRLSRYRPEPEPDGQPRPILHEPATHISRAATVRANAAAALRDREVLEAVRRHIARGLPAGGDPGNGSAVFIAALGLADATAMAYRTVGRSPSGTVQDRDAAVGAFMHVTDNLDMAVQNLAGHVPGPRSGTLAAARAGLEEACTQLRQSTHLLRGRFPAASQRPAGTGDARALSGPAAPFAPGPGWSGQLRGQARRRWLPADFRPRGGRPADAEKPPRRGQRLLRLGYRANPVWGRIMTALTNADRTAQAARAVDAFHAGDGRAQLSAGLR